MFSDLDQLEKGDVFYVRVTSLLLWRRNPDAVRKEAVEKAHALKEGFREQWAKKLRHMLVPPFAPNTRAAWGLHFDDILADGLELGPLKNKDFDLSEDVRQRLTDLTPKGVPVETSVMLYKYYAANKEDDQEYLVLPQQNFNAYFGSTAFSQKWVAALNGKVIEKKSSEGVCKYKIAPQQIQGFIGGAINTPP